MIDWVDHLYCAQDSRCGRALQGGVPHVHRHHVDGHDVPVPEDVLGVSADIVGVDDVTLLGDGELHARLD